MRLSDRIGRGVKLQDLHVLMALVQAGNVSKAAVLRIPVSPHFALDCRYEPLFDDSYSVVIGAQNSWARRRRVAVAELLNEPMVLEPPDGPLGPVA